MEWRYLQVKEEIIDYVKMNSIISSNQPDELNKIK